MPPVRTFLFVHAHPDDEALLTGGTIARAVAEGHRVVLVVATDGEAGFVAPSHRADLGRRRRQELARSAAALGVHRVECLGYRDSGLRGEHRDGFAFEPVEHVAGRLLDLVDAEHADFLIGYDPAGGYGHPDHIQVHRVTRAAARLARIAPCLFEVTYPRERVTRAVRIAAALRLTPHAFEVDEFDCAWTPWREITHIVDIRPHLRVKWAAIRAHASQMAGGDRMRPVALLSRLPAPLRRLFGSEYFTFVSGPDCGAVPWMAGGKRAA